MLKFFLIFLGAAAVGYFASQSATFATLPGVSTILGLGASANSNNS